MLTDDAASPAVHVSGLLVQPFLQPQPRRMRYPLQSSFGKVGEVRQHAVTLLLARWTASQSDRDTLLAIHVDNIHNIILLL
jgi:hypothetical protein